MLTKNEEMLLEFTLLALKKNFEKFCIVDQCSTDRTVEIIRDVLGDRVELVREPMYYLRTRGFAAARNRVSELCTLPWILHVDADEHLVDLSRDGGVVSEDADETTQFLEVFRRNLSADNGAVLPRNAEALQDAPLHSSEYHIRLYRNHPLTRWRSFIHEELWHGDQRVPYDLPRCNIVLNHLSGFKDYESSELKEEFYGWMIMHGFNSPNTHEDVLSEYSMDILKKRQTYFARMAAQYAARTGLAR